EDGELVLGQMLRHLLDGEHTLLVGHEHDRVAMDAGGHVYETVVVPLRDAHLPWQVEKVGHTGLDEEPRRCARGGHRAETTRRTPPEVTCAGVSRGAPRGGSTPPSPSPRRDWGTSQRCLHAPRRCRRRWRARAR